jgi:transposase
VVSGDFIRWGVTFMARTTTYPRELRDRAVRMVLESKDEYPTEFRATSSIASKLGIGSAETLRKWVRQAQVDAGQLTGMSSEESQQIKAPNAIMPSCGERMRS